MDKESIPTHHRHTIRVRGFDYSANGAYFITIVAQNRKCLFGSIIDQHMILNDAGKMVEQICQEIPVFLAGIAFEPYQIMPNHFHAVVYINQTGDNKTSLSGVVQRFKSLTTYRYILGVRQFDWPAFDERLWQRNYYEHIIRDESDSLAATEYIHNNPTNWEKDEEFN